MRPITSLVSRLQRDFPDLRFAPGDRFAWHPEERTVHYIATSDELPALLHEAAHAALGHHDYTRDVALLAMEREAWDYAQRTLAARHGVTVTEDDVEGALDTYRDWLHARSSCPECAATGLQTKPREYACVACHAKWNVNEARACALRRYKLA